ncbi:MAG: chemotaxis protein CheW [Janthinobacterium lividum]
MHSFDDTDPYMRFSDMFAQTRLLRVEALGTELAFDAASLCALLDLAPIHAPVRLGKGLVMSYEGQVIPLVDFRSSSGKEKAMTGSRLVVANVQHCRFALLVDRVRAPVNIDYAAIRIPVQALAERCPYLVGSVWCEGGEVHLIDLERLLGPAIRTHLHSED